MVNQSINQSTKDINENQQGCEGGEGFPPGSGIVLGHSPSGGRLGITIKMLIARAPSPSHSAPRYPGEEPDHGLRVACARMLADTGDDLLQHILLKGEGVNCRTTRRNLISGV